jgi:negative regulator of replication initiation
MREAKNRVSAYLTDEELRQFNLLKMARGHITESAFIREMLGFDVRPRGAPKGPRRKKAQKAQASKAKAVRKKKSRKKVTETRALLLPFPD